MGQRVDPAAYDTIAEWYDESIRVGSLLRDLALPALWELIGDAADHYVCDLACGQGVVARRLAIQGATVVGVDVSAKLLAIARRYEDEIPLGIGYQQDDAQTLATLPDMSFDGVVCNMALTDIPDVAATFRAVHRVLRPKGWFVFSITHPCFQTATSGWVEGSDGTVRRAIGAYFAERGWRSDNLAGVRGQVGAHHRTLSTYVNALHDAGLALERLREPRATGRIAERVRGYAEIPAVLVAACRKAVA